eukprot:CAMPEP_0179448444 /NCGR_PEP_ID=MMETSP0799-20121207/32279_1 /TAXON_ID=46947 /ORGANISM="Geminigera cryophila, Strain CCMP2564" /LENGTH=202 /DNA_ID=CAMNT_0021240271 /DNA_START=20 /DNA_END=628 /DNA_ORIENTATION=+
MLRVFTCVLLVALASAESHGGKTCVAIEATLKGGLCATKVFKGKTCIKVADKATTEANYGGMGALLTKDVCTATSAACSMYDGTVKTDFCTLSGGFCGDFIQKNDLFTAASCKTDSDCMAPVAGAATKPCCDSMKSRTEDSIKMMCTGTSSVKVTAAGDLARSASVAASTCATTNCISAASRASIVPVAAIISAIVALATAF